MTDEWYPSHDWRRDQYDEDREWRMDIIGQNGNTGEHYDEVKKPDHYQSNSDVDIECIEAIKAALTPEEFRGYCKGAAFKYIWRERKKGQEQSLRKAQEYLELLTSRAE